MADGLDFSTQQYLNPFEGIQKGITNLQGVFTGQQESLDKQKVLDLEAARQKVLDSRYQAGVDLAAKLRSEEDTQKKLDAAALQQAMSGPGIDAQTGKPVVANLAGLSSSGLSALNALENQRLGRTLEAEKTAYGRSQDAITRARQDREEAQRNVLFGQTQKSRAEEETLANTLARTKGMTVPTNPEVVKKITGTAEGVLTLPSEVEAAYSRVYDASGNVKPEAKPIDVAATKAYEKSVGSIIDKFGERRPATYGERVTSLQDQLKGNVAYSKFLGQKDVADEIAANTVRAQANKDLQAALIAQGKETGKVGKTLGGGNVSTDVSKEVFANMGFTAKSTPPKELVAAVNKMQSEGYDTNQILGAVRSNYTPQGTGMPLTGWFKSSPKVDAEAAAKVLEGQPKGNVPVTTGSTNKALQARITQLSNMLTANKSAAGTADYLKYQNELENLTAALNRLPK